MQLHNWKKNWKHKLGQKSFFYFAVFYHKNFDGDIERVSIDTPDLILSLTLSKSAEFKTNGADVHKREF